MYYIYTAKFIFSLVVSEFGKNLLDPQTTKVPHSLLAVSTFIYKSICQVGDAPNTYPIAQLLVVVTYSNQGRISGRGGNDRRSLEEHAY